MVFQTMKTVRELTNFKQIREDIATFVIKDLEAEGFEPKLVKFRLKWYWFFTKRVWRIVPKNTLSDEDQTRFDKIKNEQTEVYKNSKLEQLKEIKTLFQGG